MDSKLKKVYTLETHNKDGNLIYKVDFISKCYTSNKHYIKASKELNRQKIHSFSLSNRYLTDKQILMKDYLNKRYEIKV